MLTRYKGQFNTQQRLNVYIEGCKEDMTAISSYVCWYLLKCVMCPVLRLCSQHRQAHDLNISACARRSLLQGSSHSRSWVVSAALRYIGFISLAVWTLYHTLDNQKSMKPLFGHPVSKSWSWTTHPLAIPGMASYDWTTIAEGKPLF